MLTWFLPVAAISHRDRLNFSPRLSSEAARGGGYPDQATSKVVATSLRHGASKPLISQTAWKDFESDARLLTFRAIERVACSRQRGRCPWARVGHRTPLIPQAFPIACLDCGSEEAHERHIQTSAAPLWETAWRRVAGVLLSTKQADPSAQHGDHSKTARTLAGASASSRNSSSGEVV